MFNARSIKKIITCCLFPALTLAAESRAGLIEGIVISSQGPVQGAVVSAFADLPSLLSRRNGRASTGGERPGQFRLDLPTGTYFFIAEGKAGDNELFSYHGGNPITVDMNYQWLPFFVVESRPPACEPGPAGIGGRITYKDKAVSMGTVSVYPTDDPLLRGMGLFTNTLDVDGEFWFNLDPGSYVLVARKRLAATNMGPLQQKDLFCFPAVNPIQVEPSSSCFLEVRCYPRDDLHAFLDEAGIDPRGRREKERRSASLWDTVMHEPQTPAAAGGKLPVLSGRVVDAAGRPRPGLFVQAYPADGQPLFQMFIIRAITRHMTQTDDQGSYQLELAPGEYYLVAREKVGEAPERLEYYGLFEGNVNHSVRVLPGRATAGIDLVVDRIMKD